MLNAYQPVLSEHFCTLWFQIATTTLVTSFPWTRRWESAQCSQPLSCCISCPSVPGSAAASGHIVISERSCSPDTESVTAMCSQPLSCSPGTLSSHAIRLQPLSCSPGTPSSPAVCLQPPSSYARTPSSPAQCLQPLSCSHGTPSSHAVHFQPPSWSPRTPSSPAIHFQPVAVLLVCLILQGHMLTAS